MEVKVGLGWKKLKSTLGDNGGVDQAEWSSPSQNKAEHRASWNRGWRPEGLEAEVVAFYSVMILYYKLAWPRTEIVLASICHAITDPPVTKIWLWASFGV